MSHCCGTHSGTHSDKPDHSCGTHSDNHNDHGSASLDHDDDRVSNEEEEKKAAKIPARKRKSSATLNATAPRKNAKPVEKVLEDADSDGEHANGSPTPLGAELNDRVTSIFLFLTPSDLRLTPKALTETNVSHFRCNVNGIVPAAALPIFPQL